MIRMKYPNNINNSLCDGQIHDITPYNVFRIEDLELFLMEYHDETRDCNAYTILQRMSNGALEKIPLLNYDSLFSSIGNGKFKLTPVDLEAFFKNYLNSQNYITTQKPVKDFNSCLPQYKQACRKAIILHIDQFENIFFKDNNHYIKVDGELLLKIMQAYDIEWHEMETDRLASPNNINAAIYNTMGYMLHNENGNGLSFKDRYTIGNIHHYTVGFEYTDANGDKRVKTSI